MKLTSEQIDGLLKLVGMTREQEMTCDEFLDRVAEFVEYELAGKSVSEDLKTIEHHLELCAECREEYKTLRRTLRSLLDDTGSP